MEWIAIIISLVAVGIAIWSATIARKSVVAPLVVKILNEYSTERFLDAILCLREWKQKYDNENKKFCDQYKIEWANKSQDGKNIHKARRTIAHHFHLIERLKKMNILNEGDLMKITSKDQISFLLEVVLPLEKQLNPQASEHPTYILFNDIYKKMSVDDKDWRKNMMW